MWSLLAFRLGVGIAAIVPERLGYRLADLVGWIAYRLFWRAHRGLDANLRRVLGPDTPAAKRDRVGTAVFRNAARNYFDLCRLPRLSLEQIRASVEVRGWEKVEAALASRRGTIMISAHLGNLDLVGQTIVAYGVPIQVLAQPLEPAALFRYVAALRASKGLQIIPVGPAALRRVIATLKAGGMVGIVGDRDLQGRGLPVPFFGEAAHLPTGAIELALRQKAILLPAFVHRKDSGYLAEVEEPIPLLDTGDRKADIRANLERWAALLERRIRAHPEEWVVFEDFWRKRTVEDGR
jgi:KDO2-lipid IV(A) lauroyltransferase